MREPERPAAGPEPDAELVARARAGDRRAFDALATRHLPQVWKVVWRVVRHHEDAEDVVQEVFLSAHRALPEFRGDAKFSTWIHRIAVTRALNHLARAGERMRRASEGLTAADGDGPEGLRPEVERAAAAARRPPTPLHALEAAELRRRLADCLEKLPAAWRAVIALRDAESLAYDEIAAVVGIELGTVRSRLARARASLKDCIEGRTA